jgi:hypothetical protein
MESKGAPHSLPSVDSLVASYGKAAASKASPTLVATIAPSSGGNRGGPTVNFARDVYPVLQKSCIKCHSGEKPKARLSMLSREALLKGGKSGEPAFVPGQGSESQLVEFASDEIEDLEMPPLNRRDEFPRLSPQEITLLRTWIDQGAPWNRETARAAP